MIGNEVPRWGTKQSHWKSRKEQSMATVMLGIDLAKKVFALHGGHGGLLRLTPLGAGVRKDQPHRQAHGAALRHPVVNERQARQE